MIPRSQDAATRIRSETSLFCPYPNLAIFQSSSSIAGTLRRAHGMDPQFPTLETEEMNMKSGFLDWVELREMDNIFCNPLMLGRKEAHDLLKFTGQALWIMCIVLVSKAV